MIFQISRTHMVNAIFRHCMVNLELAVLKLSLFGPSNCRKARFVSENKMRRTRMSALV